MNLNEKQKNTTLSKVLKSIEKIPHCRNSSKIIEKLKNTTLSKQF